MRTQYQIDSIINNAKIIYSARLQYMELDREKGLEESDINEYQMIGNLFDAVAVSTDKEKDLIADILVRNGYVPYSNKLLFSEQIYNDNFDTI